MPRKMIDLDSYVIENLGKMTKTDIAIALGITLDNLSHRLRRLGIANRRQKVNPLELEDYFRRNAQNLTRAEMATELDVSIRTVARCLQTLGISTMKF